VTAVEVLRKVGNREMSFPDLIVNFRPIGSLIMVRKIAEWRIMLLECWRSTSGRYFSLRRSRKEELPWLCRRRSI
jgi:hypothetical protein